MEMILVAIAVVLVGCVSAQTGLCPQPSGDFPNPSSEQCTTFFRCVQSQPNLLRCPANQRFDFLFRVCRPQAQVDCNNQLQVYATPSNNDGARTGVGSGPVGALDGGLGGLLGGGLGAGLPQAGLLNLLLNRGGNGGNNNQLALIAALGQMMSQRRAAPVRTVIQQQRPQQRAPVGFNQQQAIPLYNPGGPFVPPPPPPQQNNLNVPVRPLLPRNVFPDPTLNQVGFGVNPPPTTLLGQQFPGIAGLVGQSIDTSGRQQFPGIAGLPIDASGPGLQFSPGQLQNLIDLATAGQQTQEATDNDSGDTDDTN